MQIKNLNFRNFVFGQSGVQGFFGELDEHPHHKWCQIFLKIKNRLIKLSGFFE
jgi:hypothetical protein